MMVIDLSELLEKSDSLSAQIEFCDQMAGKFAPHDRDISRMYQSISNSLRSLASPISLTTDPDDRSNYTPASKTNTDPIPNQK